MESKSILITGCSSGIGFYAASILKERGYQVFATARKPEDVDRLKAHGFSALQLDVNDSPSIHRALEHVLEATHGKLYALFNNAGFLQAGAVEDLSRDNERTQFETNVFGPMELTRLVLPVMRKQGFGRIIQNSSILGVVAMPYYGAYNASKFALEGFSNTLRQELRGTSIHVSILNPGPVATHLRENAFHVYQRTIKRTNTSPHQKAYKHLEEGYFASRNKRIANHPEAVIKKLIHALESSRPKTRYYIGMPAKTLAFLKRILPESALDWVIYKLS